MDAYRGLIVGGVDVAASRSSAVAAAMSVLSAVRARMAVVSGAWSGGLESSHE
jgi:hypothetical protein